MYTCLVIILYCVTYFTYSYMHTVYILDISISEYVSGAYRLSPLYLHGIYKICIWYFLAMYLVQGTYQVHTQ